MANRAALIALTIFIATSSGLHISVTDDDNSTDRTSQKIQRSPNANNASKPPKKAGHKQRRTQYAYVTGAFGPCIKFERALRRGRELKKGRSKYKLWVLYDQPYWFQLCMNKVLGWNDEYRLMEEFNVVLRLVPEQFTLPCFGISNATNSTDLTNSTNTTPATRASQVSEAAPTQNVSKERSYDTFPDVVRRSWHIRSIKLLAWNLTNFERVIWLDTDVVIQGNVDYMFEQFDASTVWGARDPTEVHTGGFGSGVMLLKPRREVLESVLTWAGSNYREPKHGCHLVEHTQPALNDCGCWMGAEMVIADYFRNEKSFFSEKHVSYGNMDGSTNVSSRITLCSNYKNSLNVYHGPTCRKLDNGTLRQNFTVNPPRIAGS